MACDVHIAFLRKIGAQDCPHRNGSLLDHLTGVHDRLSGWAAPAHVCAAGLFHSIYGTPSYRKAPLSHNARARVERAIGAEAERLVSEINDDHHRVVSASQPFVLARSSERIDEKPRHG